MDEASDTKPEAIKLSVIPALGAHQGWLWILGVPKRTGVGAKFYKELCTGTLADEMFEGSDVQIERFFWTGEDIYSDKELIVMRKILSTKDYNEQILARWETATGLVYYAFRRNANVLTDMVADPTKPLLVGCDFNVSPMSWVICQADLNDEGTLSPGGEIRVLDELREYDTWTQEALDFLWERWGGHPAGFIFYGDAAGQSRHSNANISDYIIIKQDSRYFRGFNDWTETYFPSANPYVVDRVASVNAVLRNAAGDVRVKIADKCEYLISDLENVTWREGEHEIDASDHERTHMSDALGYLVYIVAPIGFEYSESEGRIIT